MRRAKFFRKIKPGVPKRYLMFMAAFVWTFAGSMLLYKGAVFLRQSPAHIWVKIGICTISGVLFYWAMFSKISLKHSRRIIKLEKEKPCILSFFSLKSYILMSGMILMGITLRKSGILPVSYMAIIYITMGIPLSISAFRFYYFAFNFEKMSKRFY